MNKILLLTSCLAICGFSYSQQNSDVIEYSGGQKQLDKTIGKYLGTHKGMFDDAPKPDSGRKSNKYFTVFMQINKNGVIDGDIMVNACNDTSVTAVIAAAVRGTSGQWINHSGSDKWVVLPIYYLYKDEGLLIEKIPLTKWYLFTNNGRTPVVYLDKVEIILYPVVH